MATYTNIVRRPGSNRWYYRRAYPPEVQAKLGRREFMKSLGTADIVEARQRAPAAEFEFRRIAADALRTTGPSETEVQAWLRDLYERETAELTASELSSSKAVDPHREALGPMNEHHRRVLIAAMHGGEEEALLSAWAVDQAMLERGWKVLPRSREYLELARRAAEAIVEAQSRVRERREGRFDGRPSAPALVAALEASEAAAAGEPLTELLERYAAEQSHLRRDTVDQNRKMVTRFIEFVGVGAGVAAMTRANARDWKFKLREWPVKASEVRELKGKDFSAVLEANRFLKRPTIDERTVAKYLAALGSFARWLLRNGYLSENPTSGLLPPRAGRSGSGKPRSESRRSFTIEELNRLFASPVFWRCGGDRREHEPGDVEISDERYWLFPLALFTGARQGELCQLRRRDVRQENGVWLLDIRDDDEGMQLKSASSARVVPLHPALLELGFVRHVEALAGDPEAPLFPRCRRNAKGQFGEISKWISRYLTCTGVKKGRDLTFHSLRHGFVDALRRADVTDQEIQPLVGHSQATVTRGYGSEREGTIRRRKRMIDKIRFPGLLLPDPRP